VHWWKADLAKDTPERLDHLRFALARWPWATHRHIALTRTAVELLVNESRTNQTAQAEVLRNELNRTLARDPYNWELHLERAWLDLAFSTNAPRALAEARVATQLNPLQPLLAVRFARHYAARDPEVAWEFLRSATYHEQPYQGNPLHEALELALEIRGAPAALWELTPDNPHGLLTLGDFALEHDLRPMAAQAFLWLTNRVDALALASKLLQAQRPDLAGSLIPQPPRSRDETLLLAQVRLQERSFAETIRLAQSVWRSSPVAHSIESSSEINGNLEALLAAWKAQPEVPGLAARLAEALGREPLARRDLPLLRRLAQQFPDNLRLSHLVLQTELALQQKEAAARTALGLANRVTARPL
jgi:hypothetical protein